MYLWPCRWYSIFGLSVRSVPSSSFGYGFGLEGRSRLMGRQHTLGSHTWSHKDLTTLSYDELHDEFWRVEEAFIRILGKKPLYVSFFSLSDSWYSSSSFPIHHFSFRFSCWSQFRPPYGSYSDLVLQVAAERGYKKAILWSDDTEDASGSTIEFQHQTMDGVINSYPETHIVLQHSVLETSKFHLLSLLLVLW